MGKFIDLTGMRFGKLLVLERAANKGKQTAWRCHCDCGCETVVCGGDLRNGHTLSCGCLGGRKFKDLTGQRFGRLKVIGRAENKGKHVCWRCRCECGAEVVVQSICLTKGGTQSCGCLHKERITIHGMYDSKIYSTGDGIKQRCLNPNSKAYKNYGALGITMYAPWIDDFQAFYDYVSALEHYGEGGMTLDRINNGGNYAPGNLRWIDRKTQQRNRRNNVIVEYNGEQMCLAEAAERSDINYGTLRKRYRTGDRGKRLFRPVGSK